MAIRLVYRGTGEGLRIALTAFGAVTGCVLAAVLLLLVLPAPHTRTQYLIAGTAPTTIGLIAILLRTQRERSRPRGMAVRRPSTGA